MTATSFSPALAFVLGQEGSWSDDPGDPGGCTNQGITLETFRTQTLNSAMTADDLRAMTNTQRDSIYKNFWFAVSGDLLPTGADLYVFDFGVNAGPARSLMALQRALGGLAVDGRIGKLTLAAAAAADPVDLIRELAVVRRAYYLGLQKPQFLKGWLNRTNACETAALALLPPLG